MITANSRPASSSILSSSTPAQQAPSIPSARPHTLTPPHAPRATGLRHYTQQHYTRSPLSTQAPYRSSNNSSSNEESPSKHQLTHPADYARPNNIMSKTIDIRHKHQQATPSSSSTYSNMTSSGSSSNTNNTASEESRRKQRYNDSFDQPEEPFECDVSAILPVKRTTGLSMLSDYEDSEADSFNSDNDDFDIHDQDNESLAPSERRLAQQERESPHPQQQPDDIQARYLEVEPAWSPLQEGDYVDAQNDPCLYQQAHTNQQHHLNDPRSDHSSYSSQLYHEDDPMGGHARLSTIAEVSELPSINITNTRPHLQQRHDNMPQGPVVISGDLALEDLFVEGQDDLMNEEIRERLLANLKPTDILGPLHATHDFRLSELTHTRYPSEHVPTQNHEQMEQEREQRQGQEQEQDEDQQQHSQESFERAEGESDLSSHALALKREYEAMFGSRGAIDSERGSDASGLMVYENSEDMYEQDEDDDEDEFFGEEEEEDDEDEEFYAMLDMNGGGGNMILGNNIPRKPRVLAPPAGSRLPVPGSAIKQKVPLALQSNIVTRVPPPKTSPSPPQPSTPATPTQNAMTQRASQPPSTSTPRAVPASGLRVPQVAAKSTVSPPAAASAPTTPQATASQLLKASSSILDGLYMEEEEEQESHPKESAGAILARQYAEEILRKEKRESQLVAAAAQGAPKPSMLRPPSKIQPRFSALPQMPDENDPLSTHDEEIAPATSTAIPRGASSLAPTRPSGRTSSIAPPKTHARPTSKSPLQHSVPTFANDAAGRSLSRPMAASTATVAGLKAREQLRANLNGSPTRASGTQSLKSRPASMYTTSAERHSPSVSRSTSPVSNAARSSGLRSSMYEQSTHSPSVSRTVSPVDNNNNTRLNHGLRSSMYEQSTSTRSPPISGEVPAKMSTLRRQSSKESAYESAGARRRQSTERLVRSTSYERKQQLQRELEEIEAEEAALEKRDAQEEDAALEKRLVEAKKLSVRTSHPEREQDLRRRSSSKDLYATSEYHHQRRSSQHERESSAPTSPLSSPRSPRSSGGLSSKRSSMYGAHGDRLVPTLEESCKQLARIRQDIAELRDEIHQDQPGSAAFSPPLQPLSSATSGMGRMSLGSKRHSIRDREEQYHHGRRLSMEHRRASYAQETTRLQQLGLGRSDSYNSSSVPSSPEAKCVSPPPMPTKRNMFGEILGRLSMSVGSRPSASSSNHRHQQSVGQAAVAAAAATATGADGCPAQIRPKELRFSSSIAGEVQSFVTLFNRSRRQMRFEILRPAGITVTPSFGIIQPGRDQRLTVHLAENRGPGRVVVELDGEWLVPFGVAFD